MSYTRHHKVCGLLCGQSKLIAALSARNSDNLGFNGIAARMDGQWKR